MVRTQQTASKFVRPIATTTPQSPRQEQPPTSPIPWTVLLLDLPVRLLWRILGLSRPDGFESLALTCHAIYNLAVSSGLVAEHNDLKQRWQRWESNENEHHPLHLISAIQRQPIIARYVKYVKFSDASDGYTDTRLKIELKDTGALMKILEESPYLKEAGQDAAAWETAMLDRGAIWEGDAYCCVFLLTLLAGVTNLALSANWKYGSWGCQYNEDESGTSGSARQRGLDKDLVTVLHLLADPRMQGPNSALLQLLVIEPWSSDEEFGTPFQVLVPFLGLPSLRKIVGFQMEAAQLGRDFWWPWANGYSSLEELELTSSGISATQTRRILAPMRCLRTLKYHHAGFGDGAGYEWDGGAFLAGIRDSPAVETLEELSLSISSGFPCFSGVGSMKRFRRLRWLELSVELLLPDVEQGHGDLADWEIRNNVENAPRQNPNEGRVTTRLVDILPASIQEVRLLVGETVKSFEEMYEGLVVERNQVPYLAVIQLSRFWKNLERERQRLDRQWQQIGRIRPVDPRGEEREAEAWELLLPQSIHDVVAAAGIRFEYRQEIPQAAHNALCEELG